MRLAFEIQQSLGTPFAHNLIMGIGY